jgi:hypothetical protein
MAVFQITVVTPPDMAVSDDRMAWYIEGAIRGWHHSWSTDADPIRQMSKASVASKRISKPDAAKIKEAGQ